jgi:hypothetical protein
VTVRFEPRSHLVRPHQFGRRRDAAWAPFDDTARAQVAAAYLQHAVSCEVRDRLSDDGEQLGDLAARVGTTRDTLLRKLTGVAPARIEELFALVFVYGDITLMPAPGSVAELLPVPAGGADAP